MQEQDEEEVQEPDHEVKLENIGDEVSLDDLLDLVIDQEASDIHFGANARIAIRINGQICFVDNVPPLTREQSERIIYGMIPTESMKETLIRTRELDFAYEHKDGTAFRVNLFYKRKNLSGVMRRISSAAWSIDEIGLPHAVYNLIRAKQGLILVTGPTGSGKSTSMQSMLDHINKHRVEHILTIEDPIEFVFTPDKSIISQREIGSDTLSFANALRGALRQDPDVVMIGEMRDPETIMAAMNLSETGHLVFSTLHTSSAPQTISRIASAFPPEQQMQIYSRLADTLIGVISQRLVPRADRPGRVAIYEFMVVNAAIRNLIRQGDVAQMPNAIQSGASLGMIRMEKYAEQLAEDGIIRQEDYIHYFKEE
ncbi:PilT/PilU family type 4a pilus ATPase [Candidatus Peregrinibacteria bacterium]|nr:PilT/PilU family type 4a pilus ATPase [Candidatus Peregrinibacteria bacterium]